MENPIQLLISLPFRLAITVFSSPVVLIAFVVLLFYWGRRRRVARVLTLIIAIASTALAGLFLYLGFDMRWSTDGPGLLLVFIGLGGFGILGVATWVMWVVARRASRAAGQ